MKIPSSFEQKIKTLYGELGKRWLEELPQEIIRLSSELNIHNLKLLENLSYNYLLTGYQDNLSVVLKLGIDKKAIAREARALRLFSDHGGIKLYAEGQGWLLIERTEPGNSLKSYFPDQEEKSLIIFANLLKKLHTAPRPEPGTLPTIVELLSALDDAREIPSKYLDKARKVRDHLLKTAGPDRLLHGDLHHENILQHHNQWLAIDPKGVIGETACDLTAFIRNPRPELLYNQIASKNMIDQRNKMLVKNRIKKLASLLIIPEERIKNWSYVQAVLSWAWAVEDHDETDYWQTCAELICSL